MNEFKRPVRARLLDVRTWCTPSNLALVGAVMTLLVPVLVFGPWLPLTDLVSFVGMYSYPPQDSYGPLHYYVFQFSYIGVLIISRILCDFQVPVRFQIPFYYLLQTGVCLTVVYASLRRLVKNEWVRAVGVALGSIALWDGVFLWGGPLGYSLGACSLTVATFLVIRDACEPPQNTGLLVALLIAFSLCCHPFMALFALILCGVKFIFHPNRRGQAFVLAMVTVLFAVVILQDSPRAEVGMAEHRLSALFGFDLHQIGLRLKGLFTQDSLYVSTLFGVTPVTSYVVFFVLATLHVAGFVLAPVILVRERQAVWLRMLAAIDACAGALYLFSFALPGTPIGDWPQRILTTYAPVTYLTGFVGLVWLGQTMWPSKVAPRPTLARTAWAVPAVILAWITATQCQVFAFGRNLEGSINSARQEISRSGATDALLVVSGVDDIQPFYLRSVPFALFSDPDTVAHDLIISTEWHFQSRHPSRIAETSVDLGRPRYLAEFGMSGGRVAVRVLPQPADQFPVHERTNARTWMPTSVLAEDEYRRGMALLTKGVYKSAFEHLNTVVHLDPTSTDGWNNAAAALFRDGKIAESIPYFEGAVKENPNSATPQVNLAVALIASDRFADALPHLKAALSIEPDNDKAKRLRDKVEASIRAQGSGVKQP